MTPIVFYMGGSVLKVDLYGVVKKNMVQVATSGFGFQVMLWGSLIFSGPYFLKLSYVA